MLKLVEKDKQLEELRRQVQEQDKLERKLKDIQEKDIKLIERLK